MRRFFAFSLLLILGVVGCGKVRTPTAPREKVLITYSADIKPLLNRQCVKCHKGTNPDGNYDLSTYMGLLGAGSDLITRNAIAGDETSLLLTKLDPKNDADHWSYLLPDSTVLQIGETAESRRDSDLNLLKTWVVKDKLAYFDTLVHPFSWVYPEDRNSELFHGGALRANSWNFNACRTCHGEKLDGGTSQKSCYECHEQGPTSCNVCHGSNDRQGIVGMAPPSDLSWKLAQTNPGVGAHQKHLSGSDWWAQIKCNDCHLVPQSIYETGHFFDDEESFKTDLKAEVVFGKRAEFLGVQAIYNSETGSCAVYCHGAAFELLKKGENPVWTSQEAAICGSCHDVPFRFGGPDCSTCHQQSVESCIPGSASGCLTISEQVGIKFIDLELHGDGKYPLGKEGAEGTCYACHGSKETSGAPAPDLHGLTDTSNVTVGLHAVHLTANANFQAVACQSCHTVPNAKEDSKHMDDDLPAEVAFDDLAKGKLRNSSLDLSPSWNRQEAKCSNVYCHSLNGAKNTEWIWTQSSTSGLACDSCHGQPPTTTLLGNSHSSSKNCAVCHNSAYDSDGNLDPTKHINGKVDL